MIRGKRQMFPVPIAIPSAARISPQRDENRSLCDEVLRSTGFESRRCGEAYDVASDEINALPINGGPREGHGREDDVVRRAV